MSSREPAPQEIYAPVTPEPLREDIDQLPGLTLLDFGVGWCPHCQGLAPAVSELLKDHPGIRHIQVEDGPGRPLGRSFRVKLWPNLVLMKDGQVIEQLARPDRETLKAALQKFDPVS